MVDDCLPKDRQDSFLKGLSSFESTFRQFSGASFGASNQEEKARVLDEMINSPTTEISEDVIHFVQTSKSYAVLGFMRSEYLMTEIMPYSLIPGKYPACRTTDPNGKINIYG